MSSDKAVKAEEHWSFEITPKAGWFVLNLGELWRYRDLLFMFVRRDFVAVYKQTLLGPLWFFIQPIFTTLTFTIVFGNIAKISTDGMPSMLFYLAGIVGWNYFAECLNTTSGTFSTNASLFGKVYFPRLIMPLSVVISNLLKFGVQFLLFLILLAYFSINSYPIHPNIYILLVPLLIILMAGLGLGMGMIVSALTTKYRDLKFLVSFGVQLLMYATPVIYPLSAIPDKYKTLVQLNPMTGIIETFRYAFLGSGSFEISNLVYSIIITLILLFIGIVMFNRVERTFMDTV